MKKNIWYLLFLLLCFLLACLADAFYPIATQNESSEQRSELDFSCTSVVDATEDISEQKEATTVNYEYIKGIWVSQFDMQPVFVEKGVQREKESYTALVKTMLMNIKNDSFNTIFLQLRPNGDSMYESSVFPVSKYCSGAYGNSITYDAVEIFIEEAHALGISVQGWINPLRLMLINEIEAVDDSYLIKQWYKQQNGKVVTVGERLYLNPAYEEVRQLIIDGAAEILENYDIDGIHMDDYFYPTTEESFDAVAFSTSGIEELGDFRRNNINLLVKGLYEAVKESDNDAQYGIAPAGNLYSLREGYYADVSLWCAEKGYLDYIMPQLYFGFLNKSCPFDKVLADWVEIVTEPEVRLIVGLTAAKAVLAMSGEIDVFAGTEEGKNEWIENKDILYRSLLMIYEEENTNGYCFFCYQYLYNVLTGEPNALFSQEKENMRELLKYSN